MKEIFLKYLTENYSKFGEFTTDTEILRHAMMVSIDSTIFYEQLAQKTADIEVKDFLLELAYNEKVDTENIKTFIEELEGEPFEEDGFEETVGEEDYPEDI